MVDGESVTAAMRPRKRVLAEGVSSEIWMLDIVGRGEKFNSSFVTQQTFRDVRIRHKIFPEHLRPLLWHEHEKCQPGMILNTESFKHPVYLNMIVNLHHFGNPSQIIGHIQLIHIVIMEIIANGFLQLFCYFCYLSTMSFCHVMEGELGKHIRHFLIRWIQTHHHLNQVFSPPVFVFIFEAGKEQSFRAENVTYFLNCSKLYREHHEKSNFTCFMIQIKCSFCVFHMMSFAPQMFRLLPIAATAAASRRAHTFQTLFSISI